MQVQTRTTHTLLDDDGEVLVDGLPIAPYDTDYMWRNGGQIAYLVSDDDYCDYEWEDCVQFVQGNPRYLNYCDDIDGWFEQFKDDDNWVVFPVGVYEHGNIQYSLAGESIHSSDPWDYCIGAAIAIDKREFTNPKQAARCILSDYTSWCNGDVWGIVVIDLNDPDDYESCWGFIGGDYAEAEAQNWIGIKAPYPS